MPNLRTRRTPLLVLVTTGAVAAVAVITLGVLLSSEHDGASNFAVSVLDAANGSTGQLLVNTIGAYSGTTSYGFNSFGEPGVTLQITADGNWTLTAE